MLTKTDISELKKVFVTKKEFRDGLSKFSDQIIEVITSMSNAIIIELKGEIREVKDEIKIHADILDNHERRIEKLELPNPA